MSKTSGAKSKEHAECMSITARANALQINTPVEFNRFSGQLQQQVFDWLGGVA